MSNRLREIEALGQSIWLDNISRQLLEDGIMARLVEEDGISGVTSNPTIFEKAMGHSDRYDDAFREVIDETEDPQKIFELLAYLDIREAADLLRPTFEKTDGARTDTRPSRCRHRWPSTRVRRSTPPSATSARLTGPTC